MRDPRLDDPINPAPLGTDPLDARLHPANTDDPRVVNRNIVAELRGGSGVLIAAVVLVLAVIAYFIFAPASDNTAVNTDQPTAAEPATTGGADATAPAATAPAATDTAPAATDTAPAATDTAPAATDTAPAATDSTAPASDANAPAASESSAPAETAPATPAPAQ
jgi:hypothetical protein